MKFSGAFIILTIAIAVYFSWDKINKINHVYADTALVLDEVNSLKDKINISYEKQQLVRELKEQAEVLTADKFELNFSTDIIAIAPVKPVVKPVVRQTLQKARPAKVYKPYVVSMTFITANNRYAVIDGRFSRIGDVLPDGGKVIGIEKDFVKVKRSTSSIQSFKVRL